MQMSGKKGSEPLAIGTMYTRGGWRSDKEVEAVPIYKRTAKCVWVMWHVSYDDSWSLHRQTITTHGLSPLWETEHEAWGTLIDRARKSVDRAKADLKDAEAKLKSLITAHEEATYDQTDEAQQEEAGHADRPEAVQGV